MLLFHQICLPSKNLRVIICYEEAKGKLQFIKITFYLKKAALAIAFVKLPDFDLAGLEAN